jgi:RNA polymerase sigma-70 factor (ECF subfamily)
MEQSRETLGQLFSRYRVRLYNTALSLSGNHADAEDILQDGLLAAFRNFRSFEGRSQLSTWLTRIIINAALMRARNKRARPMVSIDQPVQQNDQPLVCAVRDPGPNPEEMYLRQEQLQALERALQTMPKVYRLALTLHHVQGLTIREAAELMGLPVGTLKSQLHRARGRLSREVAERRPRQGVLHTRLRQHRRPVVDQVTTQVAAAA